MKNDDGGTSKKMMRKHPRQVMVKASLWMHKDEFQEIAELSGDMSMNLFMMRAIRKAIAEEKEESKGVSGSQATNQREAPATTPNTEAAVPKTNTFNKKGGSGR